MTLFFPCYTNDVLAQVAAIPKMAAGDTSIIATNSTGAQAVVPVPQGSQVFILVSGLHYNRSFLLITAAQDFDPFLARYWDDPYQFKPSRFMSKTWQRDNFLSFSAGPRACLGRK